MNIAPQFGDKKDRMLTLKHRYVAGNLVLGVQSSKAFAKSGGDDPGTAAIKG